MEAPRPPTRPSARRTVLLLAGLALTFLGLAALGYALPLNVGVQGQAFLFLGLAGVLLWVGGLLLGRTAGGPSRRGR